MDIPHVASGESGAGLPGPVAWFSEINLANLPQVGGKVASLGEMTTALGSVGIRVPSGFALVASSYRSFLRENQLEHRIRETLVTLDLENVGDLRRRGLLVREMLMTAPLSKELTDAVVAAYARLSPGLPEGADVAVRSSATAEDLPEASFAGQHDTFLNVRGAAAVLDAVRRCYASLYNDRAISYRAERGFGQLDVEMSVGVQRMVRADLGAAGVMFTHDPETGFRDVVMVSASYGLGENVVQGIVVPDEFTVFKLTLRTGFRPVVRRIRGTKELRLVYDEGGSRGTRNTPVSFDERRNFAISNDDVLDLARQACLIEDHYATLRGDPCPLNLEWAKDGCTGELFVLQARPETIHRHPPTRIDRYTLCAGGNVVVSGRAVGERISCGRARIVRTLADLCAFQDHEVLVAERTAPDWEPVMRRAAAVVTEFGGRSSHAAIISRELGIPAVVGAPSAMTLLRDGAMYTVSCAQGEIGWVLDYELPFDVEQIDAATISRPKTRIMVEVANASEAFRLAPLPNDGVGLLRVEPTLTRTIGIHPMALLTSESLPTVLRAEIDRRIAPYIDGRSFFVDRLAESIATIAAAFYPKDVIVRLSDLDTSEYARLLGGARFEPREQNPMLGFRGASRYLDPRYRQAFGLECEALVRVRDTMGLQNTKIMLPFVRTVDEGRRVQAEMKTYGLERGRSGLEIHAMCHVPSNIILMDAFADIFDGFFIDWGNLAQLILGVDRDSEILTEVYDERDPAMIWALERAIESAHRCGRKVGLCGQPPSNHAVFAQLLVRLGIDSLTLHPDAVMPWTQRLLAAEAARQADNASVAVGTPDEGKGAAT